MSTTLGFVNKASESCFYIGILSGFASRGDAQFAGSRQ